MFVADGQQLSNGELTAEQKDAISHRGKAVRAIVAVLVDALTGEGMDQR
jgi:XTP/dITP diphosphohydrolase